MTAERPSPARKRYPKMKGLHASKRPRKLQYQGAKEPKARRKEDAQEVPQLSVKGWVHLRSQSKLRTDKAQKHLPPKKKPSEQVLSDVEDSTSTPVMKNGEGANAKSDRESTPRGDPKEVPQSGRQSIQKQGEKKTIAIDSCNSFTYYANTHF